MKQYKTVLGPVKINVGKNNLSQATDSFGEIINKYAAEGWEYHSMETLTVGSKSGCWVFAKDNTDMICYMLIFCRDA